MQTSLTNSYSLSVCNVAAIHVWLSAEFHVCPENTQNNADLPNVAIS